MTKLEWSTWDGACVLRDLGAGRNYVWVEPYADLGWSVSIWNPERAADTNGKWDRIAHHSDLETAKAIAMIYARGNLL
jgi:hypothetical protein